MSETTFASSSSGMRVEDARERISAFSEFGPAHHYFAQHTAFPMSLTVDLLYRLWANFQRDIHDEKLHIPWIAVSDLLLSSLCDEVGHELYEMDVTVRAELLRDLQANARFGQQRIHELSYFLLDYVQQQVHSSNAGVRKFAEAQQWTVLAYIQPGRAARELAESLKALEQNNRVEQIRLVSVMETLNKLAPPLSALEGFTPLLTYARGVERVARGDIEGAKAQFGAVEAVEQVEQAVGVQLPRYEGLLEVRQEVAQVAQLEQTPATPATSGATDTRKNFLISYHSADADWANWIAWQLEDAGYAIELQAWTFQSGANFVEEVDRVEQLAKHIMVILSPDYLSALASMPAWVEAFFLDPRNGPDFIVALHVRECRAILTSILGSVDYTDVVGLDEEAVREALLNRMSRLPDATAMPSLSSGVISHSLTVQPHFPGTPIAAAKPDKAVEIFISYVREDRRLREELDKHLGILQGQGLIATWHSSAVGRGSELTREIDLHLNTAQIILLLISASFVASDYIYEVEMKRALERHEAGEALVIPILLRPVYWEGAPFGKLRALPENGKPITTWASRDKAFIDVVEGIRQAIEQFTGRSSIETEAPQETEVQRIEEGDAHANKRIAGAALLWVDDQPENNIYPRRAMEAVGIRITLSQSTEDALEKVRSHAYDVIISDMGRLPPGPQAPYDYRAGYTLLDKLRDQHIFTPFIIYTSSSSAEEQEETRRRGGFGTTNNTDVLLQMVISAIEQATGRSPAETESVVEEVAEEAEDVVEETGEGVEDISMAFERVRQAAEQVIIHSAAETEAPPKTKEQWKEEGDTLTKTGRYEEALEAYDRAIALDPGYALAYHRKGNTLRIHFKHYKEALEAYDRAIALDPNYAPSYNHKGHTLHDLGLYKEALECYEQAIRLDSRYWGAYTNRGSTLYVLQRYDEALEACNRAIAIDPYFPYSYDIKGKVLEKLQRYDEALEAYEQAVHLDPGILSSQEGKNNVLKLLGRSTET